MSIAAAREPRVIHALPGRVRIHIPEWTGGGQQEIEAQLRQIPGIYRVRGNPLTGRVLVEFEEHEAELDDLLATITKLELPELPGEDRPTHPLDLGPLVQSVTRMLEAGIGLALLATRHLFGITQPLPGSNVALQTASILGI